MYWELKSKCSSSGYLSGREEELRSPADCWSTVIIPAQGNRYKACRSPDLGRLLVWLCSLLDRLTTAAPDCTQGFSISVRPLGLGQSSSQLYLILLTIILNYIVLYCVIMHSDTIFSKLVCFSSDHCRCFLLFWGPLFPFPGAQILRNPSAPLVMELGQTSP